MGDAKQVGQVGRGAGAAQVVEDAAAAGELDDVVDDEEVRPEAGAFDDAQLAAGPLAFLPGEILGRGQPGHDRLAQGLGKNVRGKVGHDVFEGENAFFGRLERALEGLLRFRAEPPDGQSLLVRAEEPDLGSELFAFRRERNLLLDGVKEDEPLRARRELERVGPDEGQAGRAGLGGRSPEVREVNAYVEVAGSTQDFEKADLVNPVRRDRVSSPAAFSPVHAPGTGPGTSLLSVPAVWSAPPDGADPPFAPAPFPPGR